MERYLKSLPLLEKCDCCKIWPKLLESVCKITYRLLQCLNLRVMQTKFTELTYSLNFSTEPKGHEPSFGNKKITLSSVLGFAMFLPKFATILENVCSIFLPLACNGGAFSWCALKGNPVKSRSSPRCCKLLFEKTEVREEKSDFCSLIKELSVIMPLSAFGAWEGTGGGVSQKTCPCC